MASKTDRILKKLIPRVEIKNPIASEMFLPNHSGTFLGGDKGLPFGAMHLIDTITVPIVTQSVPTEINDESFTGGSLNKVGFGGHQLSVVKSGFYAFHWDVSFKAVSGGSVKEIHGGIMVDDVAIMDNGESHRTISTNNDTGAMGSSGIIELNTDQEISLWVSNASSTVNLSVEHGELSIYLIGNN